MVLIADGYAYRRGKQAYTQSLTPRPVPSVAAVPAPKSCSWEDISLPAPSAWDDIAIPLDLIRLREKEARTYCPGPLCVGVKMPFEWDQDWCAQFADACFTPAAAVESRPPPNPSRDARQKLAAQEQAALANCPGALCDKVPFERDPAWCGMFAYACSLPKGPEGQGSAAARH
jgi:hypothetical protein